MLVSLDQIEFYHGPPSQQPDKKIWSPVKRKQSPTFAVTEPIRHSFPTESVFTPGFQPSAILPSGREPTTCRPCDEPIASIGDARNVFDVEFANLDHGKGGAQLQGSDPLKGNDRSCAKENDQEVQLEEDAEAYHHMEPEYHGATIMESAVIENEADLLKRPLCMSDQAEPEGSSASSLARAGHLADQPRCQGQLQGQMGAADTDEGSAPRTSSVPCSEVAEWEGIASCKRIGPGVSLQELDMPTSPRSITSSPAVEIEAVPDKQGDATGSAAPLDRNQGSNLDEISRHCRASNHEPDQESGMSKTGSYPPCQLTATSIHGHSPSPDQASTNHSKRHPFIAVVVPAPSWTRTRVTRSTTKAMARKRRLQNDQVHESGHYTRTSIDPTDRIGEKQQRRKKRPRYAAGTVSASRRNSVLSDVSPENQNIPGRAILTVQSDGLKPAYFLTFMPDLVSESSPPGPYRRPADRDRLMLAGSSATISGKPRLYTSNENARLVRLKEREGMPWAEIAEHFPGRSLSSLQVHYSTKLRRKATAHSRKRQ